MENNLGVEWLENFELDYEDNYELDYIDYNDYGDPYQVIDIGNYDDPNESGYESDYTSELDEDGKKIQEITGEDEDKFLYSTLSSLNNEDDK